MAFCSFSSSNIYFLTLYLIIIISSYYQKRALLAILVFSTDFDPTLNSVLLVYNLFDYMKGLLSLHGLPIRKTGSYLDKCPPVSLCSNLFKVNLKHQGPVSICYFKIKPNIDDYNLKEILKSSRQQIEATIGPFIFSGRTLFTTNNKMMSEDVTLMIGISPKYQIYIKKVRTIDLRDIYSQQKSKSGPVFLFLNNVIKNFMAQLDYNQIGKTRSYFDPRKKEVIDNAGIILFYGYSTRFDLRQNGLFLQITPATKIIRSESVLQVINRIYSFNTSLSKTQKRLLIQQELCYKMVMSNYGKSKYYVIQDVIFDQNIETYKFQNKGVTLNLYQYYRQTYGISVQNKRQPLIKATSGQGRKKQTDIILVPQFMLMSGLPDSFDQRKRKQISDRTIVDPNQKLKSLTGLMDQLQKGLQNFTLKSVQQKLGIAIQTAPYRFQAKKLNNPILQLGEKERIDDNKVGGFMLFNKPLFDSTIVLKICVLSPKDFDLSNISSLLSSTCKNLALKYTFKNIPFLYSDAKKIQLSVEDLLQKQKMTSNIFWFILPVSAKSHYKLIKKITLKDQNQKATQISLISTLQKKNFNSIFTKILLQMAVKVGNKLWAPLIPDYLNNVGVMLISIQSYKDSDRKGIMIVAYCSTIDSSMTAFNSNYFSQQNASGIKMNLLVNDCLSKYLKNNKKPPSEVILLKNTSKNDGLILLAEIKQIEEALKSIPSSFPTPKLTYIIVNKHSKQQFYLERNNDVANPFFGTLINSQVVSPYYDFYMIAQHCNRGTARPTYYKIVYTNSNMQEGVLQQLVYFECFNYANWTGPVRVPGPLQYAKKLAMFIGQNICAESQAQKVTDKLYYI